MRSAVGGLDDAVTAVEAGDEDHTKAVHVTGRVTHAFVLNLRCWEDKIGI